MSRRHFIEVDHTQIYKDAQLVGGDVFLSRKIKDENRIVSILSDGLGSGVKASVLATLTATMALNYVSSHFNLLKTARVIMKTLPVCSKRKISYATFSIVDMDGQGNASIIEYGNPSFILVRGEKIVEVPQETIELAPENARTGLLYFSRFQVRKGDRIILFSDGVTQAGMGTKSWPMGWGMDSARSFVTSAVKRTPDISARQLSKSIVQKACLIDGYHAGDDITCGVINIRSPRKTLVVTGPPIDPKRDHELATTFDGFNGKKIISGGTTTNIISRELNREVTVNLKDFHMDIPVTSTMEGADLITEGSLTLGKVIEILENDLNIDDLPSNGATNMVQMLMDSDIIHFVVGTRINNAHQEPNIPVELEIRRNIIKKIIRLLEEKHLKETRIRFI